MSLQEILNGKLLYTLVICGLLTVGLICIFFYRRGKKRALELGVDEKRFQAAMRSSVMVSIVPSIAVIIGLFSLAPVMGVPWPWFRLSVVGSISYELMAAGMAATSAGYSSLASFWETNDASVLGAIMFVMSVAIMTGMVCNLFLTEKIHTSMTSYRKKGSGWSALVSTCFMLGLLCVFLPLNMLKGTVACLTVITSAAVTILLTKLSERGAKWLSDYVLSAALIVGCVSSVFWSGLFG